MKNSGIEWIGNIPDNWSLSRLQWHLTEIKESNDPVKTTQVLSLTNKLGVIPYEEKGEQGNKAKERINEYKLAYPNTIVANSMNILIGSVGKCDFFGCVSPVYYVFKPKDGENINYINYIFQTEQFQKELRKYANGILEIRLRVSSSDILKIPVAFPSSEIQEKIACTLNKKIKEIDELISIVNQEIDALRDYNQSLINKSVIYGLDPKTKKQNINYYGIEEIPSRWSFVKTGRIFKEECRTPLGEEITLSLSQIDGLIPTNDMKEKSLKSASHENWKRVMCGDLVLNRFKAHLGVLFASKYEGIVSFHYGVYKNKVELNPKYFEYLYHSDYYRSILGSYSNGMVLSLQNLSNANFYQTKSVFPPINEQDEIVKYLDEKNKEIKELISLKEEKIEYLEQYKKAIIFEYITGKKEVA